MNPTVTVQIRWMLRRDMPYVLWIERCSFEHRWSEDDFLCCLRQRNCIGMVAEHDGRVLAFMIYQLYQQRLQLINFAVASHARRFGIGRQMIEKLVNKLSQQRRKSIVLDVRESNTPAQLFFQRMGFRAVDVLRGHYKASGEDAYRMQFRIDGDWDADYMPRNRMAKYFAGGDECCQGA